MVRPDVIFRNLTIHVRIKFPKFCGFCPDNIKHAQISPKLVRIAHLASKSAKFVQTNSGGFEIEALWNQDGRITTYSKNKHRWSIVVFCVLSVIPSFFNLAFFFTAVLTPFKALQRGLFHKLITERHVWAMGAKLPMLGKYSLQGKYLLENCGGREAAFQETRPREKYKDGRNN